MKPRCLNIFHNLNRIPMKPKVIDTPPHGVIPAKAEVRRCCITTAAACRTVKPRFAPVLALLALLFLPAGCAVYKIDIQQGNEITGEMLSQLEIGMSKREVGKLIGFPLVTDPFHADRWDYYFYLKRGATGEVQQHSATLHFSDDALSGIESALLEEEGGE